MLTEWTEKSIPAIRDAARRLTGAARREFEAEVAIDYCQGLLPSVSQQVQPGGTLLGNPRAALEWGDPLARSRAVYSNGVRLGRKAMQRFASRLRRLPQLGKWSVEIFPLIDSAV